YLPHYLCTRSLWQLCLYADKSIRKHEYLIEHFWTGFFPYVDKHMTLHHSPSSLNQEKVLQMNIIVEKLMDELDTLVIKSKLLSKINEEETSYQGFQVTFITRPNTFRRIMTTILICFMTM